MIYAIGDIHGEATLLGRLLRRLIDIPLQEDDLLVFLGDYIDRGAASAAVIERLVTLREARPRTIFLRGNHEQMMLDARDGAPPEPAARPGFIRFSEQTVLWLDNGGADTMESYGVRDHLRWMEAVPPSHWRFLNSTRLEHLTERYHFVHAGLLPPGETWEGDGYDVDPRLWIREPFLSSEHHFDGRIVVFGHTPQRDGRPLVLPNMIGIDTHAVGGGALTAVALDPCAQRAPEFIHVPADG